MIKASSVIVLVAVVVVAVVVAAVVEEYVPATQKWFTVTENGQLTAVALILKNGEQSSQVGTTSQNK